jgi:hypothetical protein
LLQSIATKSPPEGSYVDDDFVVGVDVKKLTPHSLRNLRNDKSHYVAQENQAYEVHQKLGG